MYVDVAQVIAGGASAPIPTVLNVNDESCLFYPGEFNLVFGDAECGKTWLCLAAVASSLKAGDRTAVIDLDHNGAASIVSRLLGLGVGEEELTDLQSFRLAVPETRLDLSTVVADLKQFKPDVVVIDSLGEVLPLYGASSNSADDFTCVHADVIKPLAIAGAAVLVVDHLPKNAESRRHGPTGTIAKLRAVGGLAVRVTMERAFRPGEGGAARLGLTKDRHGGVRKHLGGSEPRPTIGTFTLSESEGALTYRFDQSSGLMNGSVTVH